MAILHAGNSPEFFSLSKPERVSRTDREFDPAYSDWGLVLTDPCRFDFPLSSEKSVVWFHCFLNPWFYYLHGFPFIAFKNAIGEYIGGLDYSADTYTTAIRCWYVGTGGDVFGTVEAAWVSKSASAGRTIDVKVETLAGNVTVELYDEGVLVESISGAAPPRGNIAFVSLFQDAHRYGYGDPSFVSEIIVADEDTRGMRVMTFGDAGTGTYGGAEGDSDYLFENRMDEVFLPNGQKVSRQLGKKPITPSQVLAIGVAGKVRASSKSPAAEASMFLRNSGIDTVLGKALLTDSSKAIRKLLPDNKGAPWTVGDLTDIEVGFEAFETVS